MWPRPRKAKIQGGVHVSHHSCICKHQPVSSGSHVISAQLHSTCVCWQRSLLVKQQEWEVASRPRVRCSSESPGSPGPCVVPPSIVAAEMRRV